MKRMFWDLDNEMGLGFFVPILQLVKLCTIGFALAFQGSQGFVISPPSFLPVIPPREGTPGLVHDGESWGTPGPVPQIDSWRTIAPSSPAIPNGLFLHPPITLSPPTLASIPQKVNVIEPSLSPSPSTITSSPPYKVVASPSTVQVHMPPLVQPSSTQRKGPGVRPAVSTPVAPVTPVAKPSAILPESSPISQPNEHGNSPPNVHKRTANKGHTLEPVSPVSFASPPWKVEHNPAVAHPIIPKITPSILPTPHSSPTIAIPVNAPSVHPVISAVSPSKPPLSQVSPAPSPFKFAPQPAKTPFLPPKASASGSFSKSPKTPFLPQVQALLPPPPNEDCLSTVCTEPYTNSPSGAPCRCVWPMQVGLRLSVSLYTFFPLDTELASEIAAEVFMKQSQVRIMGANVASQQPDKTVVLIDLVPLGEKFDSTTAFLTFERFWHKQVLIKPSYFGDYEVLYVRYPGLPPSPPLPPSSITMIDGATYSNDRNNGRTIKPLGVDVQKRQHKDGLSGGIIAIITLSVFVAVVLCSATSWVLLKCKDHSCQPASIPKILPPLTKAQGTAGSLIGGGPGSISSSFHSSMAAYMGSAKTFSVTDIERATDNFHDSRILGEGGFGRVYSAILEDGTKVAVKVLKREDRHGDREFLAEVEMLSRLHHRNLVKLIGISTEDSFRCLVYELISNGSVESHLHGVDKETSPLDWGARMKIALGAARGLAYLHEDSSPGVIHRDFKSSNILLEDDFTPKVSDFGLARTAMDEENRHISTRIMGTFGYVAPEYAMTGHILVKSDVYSYGVVLLELLTGRKSVDMSQPPGQENLVTWARPLLASKEGLQVIIDPSLGSDVPFGSITKVAAIASMCVQPEVTNRPFMGEVVQALKLVYNECDEAIEAGSRSSSQEDLSVDLDMGVSSVSGQFPDNFLSQCSATNYDSAVDIERGLSMSELFSSSARFEGQVSGSFKRQAYSGPLRTGRSRRLWQIIRRFSRGSDSEHGTMFKF